MLHLTSGDEAARALRAAGVSGEVVGWRDSPATGPSPEDVSPEVYRDLRAAYRRAPVEEIQDLRELDRFLDEDEIVLWFDACPFDQALLLRLVDHLHGARRSCALSLVLLDGHPEVPRCTGVAELSSSQLLALLPSRRPVEEGLASSMRRAWRAFGRQEPTALHALVGGELQSAPVLRRALARLLEELPSVHNGLSRTEANALAALDERPSSFQQLALEVKSREHERHGLWMGDVALWDALLALARARRPLVDVDGAHQPGAPDPAARFRATPEGRAVLDGRRDAVALNGIDRWIGGTHLQGDVARWRYDARGHRLVGPAEG